MDQEIEVVATDSTTPAAAASLTTAAPPIVDVYSAAAYGDLPKLRAFVEQDGHSVAKPDGSGYFALHWAALNNYADAAQYIIEHGGEVNASDNTQQTALHWAAVRGSVAAADVLLQKRARVEAADLNGYRISEDWNQYQKNKFFAQIKYYYWEEPELFRFCADQVIRRCVPEDEMEDILRFCHDHECGGHFGPKKTVTKVLQSGDKGKLME